MRFVVVQAFATDGTQLHLQNLHPIGSEIVSTRARQHHAGVRDTARHFFSRVREKVPGGRMRGR